MNCKKVEGGDQQQETGRLEKAVGERLSKKQAQFCIFACTYACMHVCVCVYMYVLVKPVILCATFKKVKIEQQ